MTDKKLYIAISQHSWGSDETEVGAVNRCRSNIPWHMLTRGAEIELKTFRTNSNEFTVHDYGASVSVPEGFKLEAVGQYLVTKREIKGKEI